MANNSTRSAKTKVIHAGFLLADPDTQPKSEQSILIEGERIKAVSSGFIDPPPGGELIDLRKKFVLPGLIDCHVHLTAQLDRGYRLRKVEDSDPKVGFNAAHNAAVTLGAGFTTVRDVGAAGNPEIIFALRAAVAERKVAGPRILCVGAVLSPTGGHGQTYGYRHDVCACVQSTSGICDGVDECRRAVRRQVSHGADAIKFVATGGVLSNIKAGLDQQFTDDEIRSIVETAHRLGRRVAAHAHGAAGINAALEAGVDSIEHGSFLDARSLELFIAKGAFHVPTIIAGVTVLEMAQGDGVLTPAQIEKANQSRYPALDIPVSPLLAPQWGEEVGVRAAALDKRFTLTFAVYNLWQSSETIIDPDVGMDVAGPASERYGLEINPTYAITRYLELYGSFSANHARFTQPFDDGTGHLGTYIPDAPFTAGSLALYLHDLGPWSGGLVYRYLGNFPISSGPCVNSAAVHDFPDVATSCANAPTALGQINGKGYRQLNLDLHYAFPRGFIASLGIYNLLNTRAAAAEFWYVDRLQSEIATYPDGRADIHEHPLEPFMARISISKLF